MSDAPTPPDATSSTPAIGDTTEATFKASIMHGQISDADAIAAAEHSYKPGTLSLAEANKYLGDNRLPLIPDPAAAVDPANPNGAAPEAEPFAPLPAGKASEFSLPNIEILNGIITPDAGAMSSAEVSRIAEHSRSWLVAGEFPAAAGTSVGVAVADFIKQNPGQAKLSDGQRQLQRATAHSQLERVWGQNTGEKLAAARTLVDSIEAKIPPGQPSFKHFIERTGCGNDPRFIAAMAAQAERLSRRGPRS